MGLFSDVERIPKIRAMPNVGCLMDIPTGAYELGEHGESILNGGMGFMEVVLGRGNSYKTAISLYRIMSVLMRYSGTELLIYDTEMSLGERRIMRMCESHPEWDGIDLIDSDRIVMTDKTKYMGNAFWEIMKDTMEKKIKEQKNYLVQTPFIDREGKLISVMEPSLFFIDSLSMLTTDAVAAVQDKAEIGHKDRNVEALRDAHSKDQMIREMPVVTARGGLYTTMTAHAGDKVNMDPNAPPKKKLALMRDGVDMKNVPEKATFLSNNCWQAISTRPLLHKEHKTPEFPRNKDDDLRLDTDLMSVTITNVRGKSGPSGHIFDLIVSQTEGLKVGLSEFMYLRDNDRFGLIGNLQNYQLAILPEVNLSRTTIRGKLEKDPILRRAMTICSELCQMANHWHHLPDGFRCDPQTLYEDIKKKGYDWGKLLDTRGFWVFKKDEDKHKPFCSTMDLLNMRAGTYHPWWYKE